jgi:hypothetical protein
MDRVRRAFLLLTWMALHVATVPAWAQTPVTITGLQVALWPEYDSRSMLVIYRVSLDPVTALPTDVELPIPTSVGDPLAVAMTSSTGDLVNAQYTRQVNGEWATIRVTAESPQLQIEYYSPLVFDGPLRRFSFVWPGAPGVQNMSYEVQSPIGAQEVTISPAPESQSVGQDGLTYFSSALGTEAGPSGTEVELTYVKTSEDLTADLLSLPPTRPEPTQGGTPDLRQFIPWILLAFGVILLSAGGAWYVRLSHATSSAGRRRQRGSRPASRADRESEEMDASLVFCHNCGARATAGDRFCRSCGVRLRL